MSEVFLKLVNMSISASWLVLAVVILRLILKKAPKWVNVLLWGIVAIRLICPFSIESALSLIPSGETIPMNIEMDATPAIDSGIMVVNSIVNPVISASFTPNPAASANPLQIWIPVISILWIAGMAVLVLYTAFSYWYLRRKVMTGVLYRDNIFQSEAVSSPFVLGIFKPKIYLPFKISGQDLEHVIAHEQAHIRRKDHLWKPLGFLLLTLHWLNPLMWLAYVLLCRDIELACDEKVIKELGNQQRADYTLALLTCSVSRRSIAACPLAFGEVGVKERVKSVMHYKKPAFWIVLVAVILCIAVAVCFLTDPIKEEPSGEVPPNTVTFDAEILKIYDGYFLVAPVEGSLELNSSDQIEVPMKNMDPSLEPEVGDLIEISYSGEILETYPGRLSEVYSIRVIAEAQHWDLIPMVMVDGILYLDTGFESNMEGRCGVMDGQITSTVEGSQMPTENDQSNFGAGFDYQYGATEGTIEIFMNEKWWIFATEEVRHEMQFPPRAEKNTKFYLTIGAEGVTSIELSMPGSSGGCSNADGSPFKMGERIWLEPLDGYTDLRGLVITAIDQEGQTVWRASIPNTEENAGFTRLTNDGWTITNSP